MRTRYSLATGALVIAVGLSSTAMAAQPPNQACGGAIGKALANLENSINKQAAKSCMTAKPVDENKSAGVATRFNTKRAKAYTKFVQATDCPDVNEVIAQSVFDETTARAADLCAPGTDIPLPTE